MRIVVALLVLALSGCLQASPSVEGCSETRSGLPDLCDNDVWVNSDGEDLDALQADGGVVLIDFWTYSCINCIRTFPHLTALYDTYSPYGFTIIGVHAPEFDFEKDLANVERAVEDHGIRYPVVMDNDFRIARNWDFTAWPTHHLIADGVVVDTHIGEGKYEETEQLVRGLLEARGHELPPPNEPLVAVGASHRDITPELYAGTWRQEWTLGNAEGYRPGEVVEYRATGAPERDRIYLDGPWLNGHEALVAQDDATIWLTFRAAAANIVLGPPEAGCYALWLDGQPAESAGSKDIGQGCLRVDGHDSYDVYIGPIGVHELRLDVPAGTELYTFAFGRQERADQDETARLV